MKKEKEGTKKIKPKRTYKGTVRRVFSYQKKVCYANSEFETESKKDFEMLLERGLIIT